jgi:hypothetical protein
MAEEDGCLDPARGPGADPAQFECCGTSRRSLRDRFAAGFDLARFAFGIEVVPIYMFTANANRVSGGSRIPDIAGIPTWNFSQRIPTADRGFLA